MEDALDLMEAIDDASLASLRLLVEEFEVDVNHADKYGRIALCHAIRQGFDKGATYLLANGASVNVQETYADEDTPLHLVVKSKNEVLFEKILSNVSDWDVMNYPNPNGDCFTPLEIACMKDFKFAVTQLVQRGASFESKDVIRYVLNLAVELKDLNLIKAVRCKNWNYPKFQNSKSTPLHLAAKQNFFYGLDMLLEWGANVNLKNNEDYEENTPLHIAIENKNIDIVKLLLENGALGNICNRNGETALHLAIRMNFKEALDILLENENVRLTGTLPHCKGNSLLHFALKYKSDKSIVNQLIAFGADVNSKNEYEETPLHFAVENFMDVEQHMSNYKDIYKSLITLFKILLKHPQININAKTYDGTTPLHITCKCRADEVATLLLREGALVNETDNKGNTALHHAMYDSNTLIIPTLLKYGAKSDIQNLSSDCVMHLVVWSRLEDIFDKMIEYNSIQNINQKERIGNTLLHIAIQRKTLTMCQRLISEKADVGEPNALGVTPLICSIINDFPEGTELLLRSGASPNENPKPSGYSAPICVAIENKNETILRLLLEAGASVNPNSVDESPLHVAARENFEAGVLILLDTGADLNAVDHNKKTPLDVAVEKGHNGVADLLLKTKDGLNVVTKKRIKMKCVGCRDGTMKRCSWWQCQSQWLGTSFEYFEMIERNALRNSCLNETVGCDEQYRWLKAPCDRFLEDLVLGGHIASSIKDAIGASMLTSGFLPRENHYTGTIMFQNNMYTNLSKIGACILKFYVAERKIDSHFSRLIYYFRPPRELRVQLFVPSSGYLESCKQEIERLERVQIDNYSLFDLLSLDWKDPSRLLEKTKLLIDVLPIEEMFPIYGRVIKERFRTLQTRRDLLEMTNNIAYMKRADGERVPPEIREKILKELADEDLMAVMRSFEKEPNTFSNKRARGLAPWYTIASEDIALWFERPLSPVPLGTAVVPVWLCDRVLAGNNDYVRMFEENGLSYKLNLLFPLRSVSKRNPKYRHWSLLVVYNQLDSFKGKPRFLPLRLHFKP